MGLPMRWAYRCPVGLITFIFFSLLLSSPTRHASFPSALDHATRLVFALPILSRVGRKKNNTFAIPVNQIQKKRERERERKRDGKGIPFTFFETRDDGKKPLSNEIHTCWRAGNGVSTLSPRWQPLNYNWTRRWPLFFTFIQIREIKRRTRAFLRDWKEPCALPERLMGQPVNTWHMLLTRLSISYT